MKEKESLRPPGMKVQQRPFEDEPLVLVVDDDVVFLGLLRGFLRKNGYRPTCAPGGKEGLRLFQEEPPELVLLDANMPGLDGFSVCTALKQSPQGQEIPVIMVTGLQDAESVEQAFASGAEEYVTKPINWAVLSQRLRILIQANRDRRERLRILAALERSEERYRNLVEFSPDAVVVHRKNRILFANPVAASLIGAESVNALVGRHLSLFVSPAFRQTLTHRIRHMLTRGGPRLNPVEGRIRRMNGEEIDAEVVVSITNFQETLALQSVIRDITARKRAEEELKLAATVFATSTEAIVISDTKNQILKVNDAFTRITGYTAEEAVGKNPRFLSSGRHDADFYREMWDNIHEKGRWRGEVWNRRKDGEVYPEWLSISSIRDERGEVVRYVALFSDITRRKQAEEKVRYQANYDALTDLPNRTLFTDRLGQYISRAQREETAIALLFIDLDRFKWVNDTLGHAAGDQLLQEAAVRLSSCVRASDTVARLGGDEFTVILYDAREMRGVEMVAEKILEKLALPFSLSGQDVFISGSVGITLFPRDASDLGDLLKNADGAMYEAKKAGRNAYRFFTPVLNEQAERRHRIERSLRHAVSNQGLDLHFQPILSLSRNRIVGCEALLRWNHEQYGRIRPREFIPIAEEAGLMSEMATWSLGAACREALAWERAGFGNLFVSVNLSLRLFRDGRCRSLLEGALAETGLDPARLVVEVTEGVLLEENRVAADSIRELRQMGVHFILDNFGTGYSSLNTLKRFPLDSVKIDGAFVRGAVDTAYDAVFAHAIINLAQSLGLMVIGAGVETAGQEAFLKARGCDLAQGYHLGKPMPATEFMNWLTERGTAATGGDMRSVWEKGK